MNTKRWHIDYINKKYSASEAFLGNQKFVRITNADSKTVEISRLENS